MKKKKEERHPQQQQQQQHMDDKASQSDENSDELDLSEFSIELQQKLYEILSATPEEELSDTDVYAERFYFNENNELIRTFIHQLLSAGRKVIILFDKNN